MVVDLIMDSDNNQFKKDMYNKKKAFQFLIKNLDIYLFSNPTIVNSKLIFLSITSGEHWTGVCAVNLAVNHKENNRVCRTGCISFNSFYISKETDTTSVGQLYLTFFLNLAMHYYKAFEEKKISSIHFHVDHYKNYIYAILCGIDGFFGNIITKTCNLKFIKDESEIHQRDSINCGVFWCFFIYDTIMFHSRYPKKDDGVSSKIKGHQISVYREFIKNHPIEAVEIFRYEHLYLLKLLILSRQKYDFDKNESV